MSEPVAPTDGVGRSPSALEPDVTSEADQHPIRVRRRQSQAHRDSIYVKRTTSSGEGKSDDGL